MSSVTRPLCSEFSQCALLDASWILGIALRETVVVVGNHGGSDNRFVSMYVDVCRYMRQHPQTDS